MTTSKKLTTANDPALYERFAKLNPCFHAINKHVIEIIRRMQSKKKCLTILDLGAGTDLQAGMLARRFPKARIFAVEQDRMFFSYLKKRVKLFPNITASCHKLISFRSKQKADIIILRFVYHHIPDNLKVRFLKSIQANLKRRGVLIIVEECLGEYSDETERKKRDKEYHHYRIQLTERTGDREYVAYQKEIFERNLCPYKISVSALKSQLNSSDFIIVQTKILHSNDPSIDYELLGQAIICSRR